MLNFKAFFYKYQVSIYTFFIFNLITTGGAFSQNSPTELLQRKYKNLGQNYRISSQHMSKQSGVLHTYYVQTLHGLDIINSVASIHIKETQIIKENNGFEPRFFDYSIGAKPNFSFVDAIQRYAQSKSIKLVERTREIEVNGRTNDKSLSNQSLSPDPIPVQLAYVIIDREIKLIYRIQLWREQKMTDIWLDAIDGSIMKEVNMTTDCGFDHSSKLAHNCSSRRPYQDEKTASRELMAGTYKVFPLGVENPLFGERILVNNPADVNASPFGWHDTNGINGADFTDTRGNNVDAKDDINSDDEASTGTRPNGTSSLIFDFPWNDTTSNISTVKNASTTNLFYWNNIVHDVSYQYGFDEAAGNFQMNNYGKGGQANDAVFADDIDREDDNNANFSTPIDGIRPRMQMFEWNTSSNIVTHPTSLYGNKDHSKAAFGPVLYSVIDSLVLAIDNSGAQNDGCSAIINNVVGKIVLIDRGTCHFSLKVYNAQLAGAVGVIIVQNTIEGPINMPAGDNAELVTIPSQMILLSHGNTLKNALLNNNTVVINLASKITNSSMDNGVVAHEYAHGISTRLTGGAANSSCLNNGEQMGEGWSDWLALMLTMKSSDTATKPRGIGNYLVGDDTLGQGIRTYRYSTDMLVNPFTYADIANSESEHYIGSVWATMLWDLSWAMIEKYGYSADLYYGSQGNNRAIQLIIEGMKLQPCSPGFIDGRDAILLADQLLYNGANQCLIWRAFARRGLGFSADQGSTVYNNDGIEAFDLPPSCADLALLLTSDRPAAAYGDSITFTIKVFNNGAVPILNLEVKDTLSSEYSILSVSHDGVIMDTVVTFPSFTLNAGDSTYRVIYAKLVDTSKNVALIKDDVEDGGVFFPKNNTIKFQTWDSITVSPFNGTKHWFAKDDTSTVEKYLTLTDPIVPTAFTKLSFWHKFNTEPGWDGGQVQYSTDKLFWSDLGSRMIAGGYNSTIDENSATPAFSGVVLSYFNTVIDLGDLANQVIYIRFRMHCDPYVGGDGWYVDNIRINDTKKLISNVACQTNSTTNFSCVQLSTPVRAVPCHEVYVSSDVVQGSLRRAIGCSNHLDTVKVVGGLSLPILNIEGSTIQINKNIAIGSWDNTLNIASTQFGHSFEILAGSTVTFQNIDLTKSNSTAADAILNSGHLTVKNVQLSHN